MMQNAQEENVEIPFGTDPKMEAMHNFWSSAKWRTLYCLIEDKGSLPISEMARMVGLSVASTVVALEGLEICGLIKKSETGYTQLKNTIRRYQNENSSEEIISDFLLSSNQVNNRMLETINDPNHQTRSLIYNSNKTLVKDLYAKIDLVIAEFKEKSDMAKQSWDGVYAVQLAFIEMSKGN